MSTIAPEIAGTLDLETFLKALADEPDVPCAWYTDPTKHCEQPARWAYRCEKCREEVHVCDYHRQMVDHIQHTGHVVVCNVIPAAMCREPLPSPIPWRPL